MAAIKFTVNGQFVECDRAEDAAAILSAMSGPKRRQVGRPAKTKRGRASERPVMPPNVRLLLQALKEVHPNEVNTSDLAEKLGSKSAKSLPPLVTALRNWARKAHLEPDTIMIRKSSVEDGKPLSVYLITEEGIDVLQKELSRP